MPNTSEIKISIVNINPNDEPVDDKWFLGDAGEKYCLDDNYQTHFLVAKDIYEAEKVVLPAGQYILVFKEEKVDRSSQEYLICLMSLGHHASHIYELYCKNDQDLKDLRVSMISPDESR